MGAFLAIYKSFEIALVQADISPSLPIEWTNVNNSANPPYLSFRNLPIDSEVITLGGRGYTRHAGTLQISVVYPENTGEVAAMGVCDQIAAAFPLGRELSYDSVLTRILRAPSIAPSVIDPPKCFFPVRIGYQCDEPRG